jgi:hypothetical protein
MVSNNTIREMEQWLDDIESKIESEEQSLGEIYTHAPRETVLHSKGLNYKEKIRQARERLD